MTRMDEQLEFLLSRSADADLSADERAAIGGAIAQDAECARVAASYERLSRLLRGFRPLPANMNWPALAAAVSRRVASEPAEVPGSWHDGSAADADVDLQLDDTGENDDALQELLGAWAKPLPPVDWRSFRAGVSREIRREVLTGGSTVRRTRRWAFVAWAAPVAAAAAIALAVIWPRNEVQRVAETNAPAPKAPIVLVELDQPAAAGSIRFDYDESFAEEDAEDNAPSVSAIAIGAAPGEWREFDDEQYLH